MKEQYILKQIKKPSGTEVAVAKTDSNEEEKEIPKLERGTIMERLKTDRSCFFLEYDKKAGFLLFFLFPKLNIDVVKKFQQMQEIEIAFSKINEMGFLCLKLEDLNWIECPIPLCFFVQGKQEIQADIKLSFLVVKSDIGFIEEIYSVPLSEQFQEEFKKELNAFGEISSEEAYERKIDMIYLTYDTPEKMKNAASLRTKIVL